jgi:hypothetical protein
LPVALKAALFREPAFAPKVYCRIRCTCSATSLGAVPYCKLRYAPSRAAAVRCRRSGSRLSLWKFSFKLSGTMLLLRGEPCARESRGCRMAVFLLLLPIAAWLNATLAYTTPPRVHNPTSRSQPHLVLVRARVVLHAHLHLRLRLFVLHVVRSNERQQNPTCVFCSTRTSHFPGGQAPVGVAGFLAS